MAADDASDRIPQDEMAKALSLPIPRLYVNSMINGVSVTEITSVLTFNNMPLAIVSMSFSMAKTYARLLERAVEDYENVAGVQVPFMEDVNLRRSVLPDDADE